MCGMTGGKADAEDKGRAEDDVVGADKGKRVVFNEDSRQALGVPCDWTTAANLIRETGRRVPWISSEMRVGKGT